MRMNLGENMKMALTTLHENKMRSFLTVLGVVIGITALVVVVSIVEGLYADMSAMLNDYGPNTLFIAKFNPGIHTGRLSPEELNRKSLTFEDAEAMAHECPMVDQVAVAVYQRIDDFSRPPIITARYKDKEANGIDYSGGTPNQEEVFNAHTYIGRFFSEAENLHREDVAVIGHDLGTTFFPDENPIGKTIVVEGVPYRVVGVLEKRKGQLFQDPGAEKQVIVPYRTFVKHHPNDEDVMLGAMARPGHMPEAEDEIRAVLRIRRNVPYSKPDTFGISSAQEITQQFKQITGTAALLIAVVASIGLLVGGVGVMNIMLMSVTQRTREIGVRKAIGARRRDVTWQFLTEAMVLTGTGGVVGVLLALGISELIHAVLPALPSVIPLWAILIAVGVSMSVGLFFGMYPAIKAARLDPVEALRYE